MERADYLDWRINSIENKLRKLRAEKKTLVAERKSMSKRKTVSRKVSQDRTNLLVDFLKSHPNSDKKAIRKFFKALPEQEITNLLTRARRNYQIYNEGSRARPSWVAISGRREYLEREGVI